MNPMSSYNIEENCLNESFVCPQWLPGGKFFWFRKQRGRDSHEFVLVDIVGKTVSPAFDHAKVANELKRISDGSGEKIAIDPFKLPFTWIELGEDGVRFRFNQQIWHYATGNGLSRWDGQFSQANPALSHRPRLPRFGPTGRNVSVTFTNQTKKAIGIYHVKNHNGKAKLYMHFRPNSSLTLRTNVGELWRFVEQSSEVEPGSERLRGHYCVPDQTHDVVVVGDVDFKEYWGREEVRRWEPTVDEGDLPEGWVQLQDSEGQTWYHDTVSLDSSWSRPRSNLVREDQKTTSENEISLMICNNVYMVDEKGTRFQLTSDGNNDIRYSETYLCPNKKLAVIWQYSGRTHTNTAYTLDYSPPDQLHTRLIKDEYAGPGNPMRLYQPLLFDLSTKSRLETCGTLLSNPYEMEHLGWSKDGSEYRFIFKERGFQCIRILAYTSDGQVRLLLEETSNTFIDHMKFYYRILEKNNVTEMIWASERDGYNHLYLIDLQQGRVIRQITKGCWNVKAVEDVDDEEKVLLVSAYGWGNEDPYHLHLVRINIDGTGCRALTKGDGTHIWSWAPNRNERDYFVDSWSRVDLPPQTVVRSMATGEVQLKIDSLSAEELMTQGWEPHERFATPGRDGKTLIYGVIAHPPGFDKSLCYPVLDVIYAGPQGFFTPKSFGGISSWAIGTYVMVQMDGMGTNWRSKSFHNICYKNLKDAGLPDRILWIKRAAKTRPWMDLTRVGIMGASAGGDNALSALLHHSDFYKVGVSDSGSHDHLLGNLEWSEQWLGYPVDESYTDNSNLTHADKLRDDVQLMLIAGGRDQVVNPASTMKVVTRLNKLKKDFEFLFIPEGGHNCGINGPGLRSVRRFIKENLGSGRDPKTDENKQKTVDNCSKN